MSEFRVLKIERCGQCPHFQQQTWAQWDGWCNSAEKAIWGADVIPDFCPLPKGEA